MSDYPFLDICARIEGHQIQHELLREHCHRVTDWEGLLLQAEKEGMTPLLKKHLEESGCEYPITVRRSLDILNVRHRHQTKIRLNVLQDILELLNKNGITPLVIKGAALCHTTYPDPSLRPMRDVDLLLRRSEVDRAQALMREAGFSQSKTPIPKNHYHLPSLNKKVGEVNICIELHRGLYPDCPPYYPEVNFEKLLSTARSFKVGTMDAMTLNDEETIHYVYQHAFRAPLTYETYKLIYAADLTGFTEKHINSLDFERVRHRFPSLYDALPLMHHISPWNPDRAPQDFSIPKKGKGMKPIPFVGWPHKRMRELKAEGVKIHHLIWATFLPSRWWVGVYYGAVNLPGYLWCLFWRHPRHVFWWVKLFFTVSNMNKFN